jgi:hypothetical protein
MCVPVHKIYQAFRLACIQELIHRGGPSMKRSFDRDTFCSVAPYSSLFFFVLLWRISVATLAGKRILGA